mmetsp:Transcript_19718/g.39061  ORF Transcript_19718/g.39061 Transcript_19718/m.39061 type:complete len:514 (-) Transcript_19718:1178-2719(-)
MFFALLLATYCCKAASQEAISSKQGPGFYLLAAPYTARGLLQAPSPHTNGCVSNCVAEFDVCKGRIQGKTDAMKCGNHFLTCLDPCPSQTTSPTTVSPSYSPSRSPTVPTPQTLSPTSVPTQQGVNCQQINKANYQASVNCTTATSISFSTDTTTSDVFLPNLVEVKGHFIVKEMKNLRTFRADKLRRVGGKVEFYTGGSIYANSRLTELHFPELVSIGTIDNPQVLLVHGYIYSDGSNWDGSISWRTLQRITFPRLRTVKYIRLICLIALGSFQLPLASATVPNNNIFRSINKCSSGREGSYPLRFQNPGYWCDSFIYLQQNGLSTNLSSVGLTVSQSQNVSTTCSVGSSSQTFVSGVPTTDLVFSGFGPGQAFSASCRNDVTNQTTFDLPVFSKGFSSQLTFQAPHSISPRIDVTFSTFWQEKSGCAIFDVGSEVTTDDVNGILAGNHSDAVWSETKKPRIGSRWCQKLHHRVDLPAIHGFQFYIRPLLHHRRRAVLLESAHPRVRPSAES